MKNESKDESAEFPRILRANLQSPEIVSEFLRRFRPKDPRIPSNLPTACTLEGRFIDEEELISRFGDSDEILLYWDMQDSLRREQVSEVFVFLKEREPWEDYDFCIFPEDLSWCIGFTHNDTIILKENVEQVAAGNDTGCARSSPAL